MLSDAQSGLLMMEDLNQGCAWERSNGCSIKDRGCGDCGAPAVSGGQTFIQEQKCFMTRSNISMRRGGGGGSNSVDTEWLVEERDLPRGLSRPGYHSLPIHGDGNVSNILISDAGEVRLIDWDRAPRRTR